MATNSLAIPDLVRHRTSHGNSGRAFKLWLAVNHKPTIQGEDHGIWRRLRLLPFTVTIPSAEQDRQLADKLRAELPGILRWAVDGCQAWQQEGLEPPDVVREATGAYQAEMSVIARFVQDCCSQGPDKQVNKADLFVEYQGWCTQAGEATAVSPKAFTQTLREQGFVEGKSGNHRLWRGLALASMEPMEMAS